MIVSKGKVVTFRYTLKSENGDLIETNENGDPMKYLHGTGAIVPGLESSMEGKEANQSYSVTITPEEGYGLFDDSLIFSVPKSSFNDTESLEVGMSVETESKEGYQIFYIKGIEEETVILDGNHPLAGQKLHFDIEINEVRDATSEEKEHGHVHDHHHH